MEEELTKEQIEQAKKMYVDDMHAEIERNKDKVPIAIIFLDENDEAFMSMASEMEIDEMDEILESMKSKNSKKWNKKW